MRGNLPGWTARLASLRTAFLRACGKARETSMMLAAMPRYHDAPRWTIRQRQISGNPKGRHLPPQILLLGKVRKGAFHCAYKFRAKNFYLKRSDEHLFHSMRRGPGVILPTVVKKNHLRILVVDDQHSVLLTYTWVLQREGYVVTAASTCDAALAHLESTDYDLLLCDLGLDGGRSGLEVIDFAQTRCPDIASVLLTGYLSPEIVDDARKRGIALLAKPTEVCELLRTLKTVAAVRGAA